MKRPQNRPHLKARETVYCGIRMRSRTEALYAAWLDEHGGYGDTWTYEPTCFAGPEGQWLPDFGFTEAGLRPVYVEVKPSGPLNAADLDGFHAQVDPVLRQMQIAWLSEPDAVLVLNAVDSSDMKRIRIATWSGRDGAWERYLATADRWMPWQVA